MNRRNLTNQFVLGAIMIVVGVTLLVETTDTYDASILLQYVPSLFVLLGVYALISSDFRNLFGPIVVVAVAGPGNWSPWITSRPSRSRSSGRCSS